MDADALRAALAQATGLAATGRIRAVTGLSVRLVLPAARVGDVVWLRGRGEPLLAEIVGFDRGEAVAVPLGSTAGLGVDDVVESSGAPLQVSVGKGLLGRVLDGLGRPLDGKPPPAAEARVPADRSPPSALRRRSVGAPLPTGVRVIDGLLTLGVGQRVGLFAGSGVGKSTLLGAIARGARADVVVVALVGERGREVGEFLEQTLGEAGRARSVIVVATSDAPALERLRAAHVATAIAEWFRDGGQNVLLLVDSVTRFARAAREVGLSAGEPPARRGYPPSVFAALPRLLERSGQGERGSITAVYSVLVEGGDMDEPIADEVRGILDGHIVLSRDVALRGQYPAIDVPSSLSRVMPNVVGAEQLRAAAAVRTLIAAYESKRELIALGAYTAGSDALVDRAIAARPAIDAFLRQEPHERSPFDATAAALAALSRR